MARESNRPKSRGKRNLKRGETGGTVFIEPGKEKRGKSRNNPNSSHTISAPSSTKLTAVTSARNKERNGKEKIKPPALTGLSIAKKMSIYFGGAITVTVFVCLLFLSGFVEGKLESEVRSSGIKASQLLSITGRIIANIDSTLLEQGVNRGNLKKFYNAVAKEVNDKADILYISIQNPQGEQILGDLKMFKESGFESNILDDGSGVSGVKVSRGEFIRTVDGTEVRIPSFKFEMPIYENKILLGASNIYLSTTQIKDATEKIRMIMWSVAILGAVVGVLVAVIVSGQLSMPIMKLVEDIQIVSSGELGHKTKPSSNDEIGVLARAFNKMTENLRYQQDLEIEAERRLVELSHAKEIQQRLLPRKIPNLKGIDIHQFYQSAKEVGGDYYDIMKVNNQNIALLVADVSGKGIPGSMVMTETRTILQIIRNQTLSTKKTMSIANRLIAGDIKPGMFVTMMYCILDVVSKTMLISSAGHNPLMIHRENGEFLKINPKGIALGFDKGAIFDRVIAEERVQLFPGDRVVMYTDGVVEAMNPGRDEYGEERLERVIMECKGLSSKDFVSRLMSDLKKHQSTAEQHDDITILTFKV